MKVEKESKSNKADTVDKKKLTPKEELFCQEYIKDMNGARAAKRAKYAPKYANVTACLMRKKPHIKSRIEELLEEERLGSGETVKILSDIAKSSLNDYFTIREVPYTPMVKKHLSTIIKEIEDEIEIEKEYVQRVDLEDDEYQGFLKKIERLRKSIIRYEILLEKNPNAYEIVPGETVLVSSPELDLPKLIEDKERGKIKTLTPTQFGLKVELYSAESALAHLAKVHGIYAADKQEITGKDGAPLMPTLQFISAKELSQEQIDKLINAGNND